MYPYYQDDKLTFDFLTPTSDAGYAIPRTPGMPVKLRCGEPAFLALQRDALGDYSQVESIYRWQNAKAVLIWKNQP